MTDSLTATSTVDLSSGAAMPLLGFGTWQLSGDEAYDAVRHALDAGYRHLDTATVYGNEREVGRALRDSGVDRGEVFVTTKLPPEQADKPRQILEQSLDALGVDQVDLWLIHWPPGDDASPDTWQELLAARSDGLARAVGVSNYSTAQIDELVKVTGDAPEVNQIEWGPMLYDGQRVRELDERNVVLEGYSPFKTSKLDDTTLTDVAETYGVSAPQVIVRWHLQHGIVVIPKSAHRERIESNIDVFGFSLSDEEMGRIDQLGQG